MTRDHCLRESIFAKIGSRFEHGDFTESWMMVNSRGGTHPNDSESDLNGWNGDWLGSRNLVLSRGSKKGFREPIKICRES